MKHGSVQAARMDPAAGWAPAETLTPIVRSAPDQTNTSVLFVTHSIPEAVILSTEVVVLTGRPGRVVDRVAIDLPQPRTAEAREDPRFHEHVARVRHALGVGS